MSMPPNVVRTALFLPDHRYRYVLTRAWTKKPKVMWIGLNPSIADASIDDPTIRRCSGFARDWGMAGSTC